MAYESFKLPSTFKSELSTMNSRTQNDKTPMQFNPAGVYRGKVVDNNDPLRSGRLLVEVPGVLNVGASTELIKDTYIWSVPKGGNCYPGWGSYIIPPIGSNVFIEFEGSDFDKPLYSTGGWVLPKLGTEGVTQRTDRSSPNEVSEVFVGSRGESTYSGSTLAPEDAFIGVTGDNDNTPPIDVIHRTMKGHVLRMNESDLKESIDLIDRGGNIFKMVSPYSINTNTNNLGRRAGYDDSTTDPIGSTLGKHEQLIGYLEHNDKLDWYMLMKMRGNSTFRILEGLDNHSIYLKSSLTGFGDDSSLEQGTGAYDDQYTKEIKSRKLDKSTESSILIESYPDELIRMITKLGEILIKDDRIELVLEEDTNQKDEEGNLIYDRSKATKLIIEKGKISVGNSLVVEGDKVSVIGDLHVSGVVHSSNVVTSSVDVNSHTHTGVESGGDESGAPVNSGGESSPSSPSSFDKLKSYDDDRVDDNYNSRTVLGKSNNAYFSEGLGEGADHRTPSSEDAYNDNLLSEEEMMRQVEEYWSVDESQLIVDDTKDV